MDGTDSSSSSSSAAGTPSRSPSPPRKPTTSTASDTLGQGATRISDKDHTMEDTMSLPKKRKQDSDQNNESDSESDDSSYKGEESENEEEEAVKDNNDDEEEEEEEDYDDENDSQRGSDIEENDRSSRSGSNTSAESTDDKHMDPEDEDARFMNEAVEDSSILEIIAESSADSTDKRHQQRKRSPMSLAGYAALPGKNFLEKAVFVGGGGVGNSSNDDERDDVIGKTLDLDSNVYKSNENEESSSTPNDDSVQITSEKGKEKVEVKEKSEKSREKESEQEKDERDREESKDERAEEEVCNEVEENEEEEEEDDDDEEMTAHRRFNSMAEVLKHEREQFINEWLANRPPLCSVCLQSNGQLEKCTEPGCDVMIHPQCYYFEMDDPRILQPGKWRCERCHVKAKLDDPKDCLFCDSKYGALRYVDAEIASGSKFQHAFFTHVVCAMALEQIYEPMRRNEGLSAEEIPPKYWKAGKSCCIPNCPDPDAGVRAPCGAYKCKQVMHATCGQKFSLFTPPVTKDDLIALDLFCPKHISMEKGFDLGMELRMNEYAKWIRKREKFDAKWDAKWRELSVSDSIVKKELTKSDQRTKTLQLQQHLFRTLSVIAATENNARKPRLEPKPAKIASVNSSSQVSVTPQTSAKVEALQRDIKETVIDLDNYLKTNGSKIALSELASTKDTAAVCGACTDFFEPFCTAEPREYDVMLVCNSCHHRFHGGCLNPPIKEPVSKFVKKNEAWLCEQCLEDMNRRIAYKNAGFYIDVGERRKRPRIDYRE